MERIKLREQISKSPTVCINKHSMLWDYVLTGKTLVVRVKYFKEAVCLDKKETYTTDEIKEFTRM